MLFKICEKLARYERDIYIVNIEFILLYQEQKQIKRAIKALYMEFMSVFLIQNTIKLTIYARQDEISIEQSVGATNGFIRAPFVVEGMVIGVMGALIPIALTVYGYYYAYQFTGGYLISSMFRLVEPMPFVLYLSAGLLAAGVLVGLVGSYFSVSRYLKVKR